MKPGQTYIFTPTGKEFKIAKVTDKNISWYVGFEFKGGNGINTLRMVHTSVKRFQSGIERGVYILKP